MVAGEDRMLRWEILDLAEFCQRSAAEKTASKETTDKLMVLPGFEMAHTKRKPVTDIITWVQWDAEWDQIVTP